MRALPRITWRDWLIVAGNLVLVAAGLIMAATGAPGAFAVLAFFAACLALALFTIRRKLRESAFEATKVSVVGGAPIRLSRSVFLSFAGAFFVLGLALATASGVPRLLNWLGAMLGALGAVMLVGAALGLWPDGFIQFDPEGLTLGRRAWRTRIDWDDIAHVQSVEFADNPMLCISLAPEARPIVTPREATAKALSTLRGGPPFDATDVIINTLRYGIELPAFEAAIIRYCSDPAARAELRLRSLPRA